MQHAEKESAPRPPASTNLTALPRAQCWLFYSTNVCLPWISLLFGAVVLGLVQVQRLGSHPAMTRIVQPVLTAVAVAATLAKLLLMHGAERREVVRAAAAGSPPAVQAPDTDLPYFSGEAWLVGLDTDETVQGKRAGKGGCGVATMVAATARGAGAH